MTRLRCDKYGSKREGKRLFVGQSLKYNDQKSKLENEGTT